MIESNHSVFKMSENNEKCPLWFPGAQGDTFKLICFVQQKVQTPWKVQFTVTNPKIFTIKLQEDILECLLEEWQINFLSID